MEKQPKQVNIKNLRKRYKAAEDRNDHNKAAMLLIEAFSNDKNDIEVMEAIIARYESQGYMLGEDIDTRYQLSKKYWPILVNRGFA